MKKLFFLFSLYLTLAASAQSVSIRVISNDGSIQATNTVNIPAIHVQGLLAAWADDTKNKGGGTNGIPFNAFVIQELTDKSAEWRNRGGKEAAKTFASALGYAGEIGDAIIQRWGTFTAAQKTNIVNVLILQSQ